MPGKHKIALNGFGRLGLAQHAALLASAADAVSVREKADVPRIDTERACEPPVVYVLKPDFDSLSPDRLRQLEQEHGVRLVPVCSVHNAPTPQYLRDELLHTDLSALMAKAKPVPALESPYIDPDYRPDRPRYEGRQLPKDYHKRRKAKAKAQRQARRKGRKR